MKYLTLVLITLFSANGLAEEKSLYQKAKSEISNYLGDGIQMYQCGYLSIKDAKLKYDIRFENQSLVISLNEQNWKSHIYSDFNIFRTSDKMWIISQIGNVKKCILVEGEQISKLSLEDKLFAQFEFSTNTESILTLKPLSGDKPFYFDEQIDEYHFETTPYKTHTRYLNLSKSNKFSTQFKIPISNLNNQRDLQSASVSMMYIESSTSFESENIDEATKNLVAFVDTLHTLYYEYQDKPKETLLKIMNNKELNKKLHYYAIHGSTKTVEDIIPKIMQHLSIADAVILFKKVYLFYHTLLLKSPKNHFDRETEISERQYISHTLVNLMEFIVSNLAGPLVPEFYAACKDTFEIDIPFVQDSLEGTILDLYSGLIYRASKMLQGRPYDGVSKLIDLIAQAKENFSTYEEAISDLSFQTEIKTAVEKHTQNLFGRPQFALAISELQRINKVVTQLGKSKLNKEISISIDSSITQDEEDVLLQLKQQLELFATASKMTIPSLENLRTRNNKLVEAQTGLLENLRNTEKELIRIASYIKEIDTPVKNYSYTVTLCQED